MEDYRLKFTKTGRAIYMSHLDLMRTLQRAFMRAGIPLKYSEGFNPHAVMSIALPLSVGAESLCELMDFRLRAPMEFEEITRRLNRALPEGIEALEVYEAVGKFREIKWLEIEGVLEYDDRDARQMQDGVTQFFSRESIIIEKKTKSGVGPHDIAPAIKAISFSAEEKTLNLKAVISAQNPTLNPEHLISALRQLAPELAPDYARFKRLAAETMNN